VDFKKINMAMSNNDNLENFYSGDKNWNNLVEMAKDDFLNDVNKNLDFLQKLDRNLDLAVVIYAKLGSYGFKWIDNKIPALGGLTAQECLKSENLIIRLKECLLRM
jgi:hypothetical protein